MPREVRAADTFSSMQPRREFSAKRRLSKVPILTERSTNMSEKKLRSSTTTTTNNNNNNISIRKREIQKDSSYTNSHGGRVSGSLTSSSSFTPTSVSISQRKINNNNNNNNKNSISFLSNYKNQPYYWSPLHTSYAEAVVAEHDKLIKCYEKQFQSERIKEKKKKNDEEEEEEEEIKKWLATAISRCDALQLFMKEHQAMYGNLDADKIQEVESCLYRLLYCVEKAQLQLQELKKLNSTRSSVGSLLDVAKAAGRPLVTRAKHISFANPLFRYFSSSLSVKNEIDNSEKQTKSSITLDIEDEKKKKNNNNNENNLNIYSIEEVYSARTSGVFYGSILQPIHMTASNQEEKENKNKNIIDWRYQHLKYQEEEEEEEEEEKENIQQYNDFFKEEEEEENIKKNFKDAYPYWLLSSTMEVTNMTRLSQQQQQELILLRRQSFQMYVIIITICCLILIFILWFL